MGLYELLENKVLEGIWTGRDIAAATRDMIQQDEPEKFLARVISRAGEMALEAAKAARREAVAFVFQAWAQDKACGQPACRSCWGKVASLLVAQMKEDASGVIFGDLNNSTGLWGIERGDNLDLKRAVNNVLEERAKVSAALATQAETSPVIAVIGPVTPDPRPAKVAM